MNENLYGLLRYAFSRRRHSDALILPDGRSLSYGALSALVDDYARLLATMGIGPGDRVLVQTGKHVETVALYLASLHRGAVYVPLNTAYTDEEVGYFLGDAEPSLVVCAPEREGSFRALVGMPGSSAELLSLGDGGTGSLVAAVQALGPGTAPEIARRDWNDLAAILYTSGTTGRSKGAMLSHGNLAFGSAVLIDYWGWRDDDVLLHALPIFHVHGLFVAMHCAMLKGTPMLFHPGFDAEAVLADLPRASVLMGVPTFYTRLLGLSGLDESACANVRLFVSGSAPLTPATFEQWRSRTGHTILERYGMSETMMIASNPLSGERIAGTVGYPLPGVELRIADDSGSPVPAGDVGVVEVRGPNVFSGYWRLPEKTASEFRADGFFITGDQAMQAEDGRVSIVGREKDMIISGGYNVYPREIEALIDAMPEVRESAVIGVPHPDFGEGVVAVVVPVDHGSSGATDGSAVGEGGGVRLEQVQTALANRIARFKQPKAVFNLPELPRNSMGKVQKNQLRERFARTFQEPMTS